MFRQISALTCMVHHDKFFANSISHVTSRILERGSIKTFTSAQKQGVLPQWINLYFCTWKQIACPEFMHFLRQWVSMCLTKYFRLWSLFCFKVHTSPLYPCGRCVRPLRHPFFHFSFVWDFIVRFMPRRRLCVLGFLVLPNTLGLGLLSYANGRAFSSSIHLVRYK